MALFGEAAEPSRAGAAEDCGSMMTPGAAPFTERAAALLLRSGMAATATRAAAGSGPASCRRHGTPDLCYCSWAMLLQTIETF